MTKVSGHDTAPRQRPRAKLLAMLCAASANACAQAIAPSAVSATRHADNVAVENCNDSGPGSLREALGNAQAGDTVDLTALHCSTISLTTGALVFTQSDIAITGPGANLLAIDGRDASAVLYHLGAGRVYLTGMSIINGHKYRSDGDATGACVHADGRLILDHVSVRHCTAAGIGSRSASGGAVWVQGSVRIYRSTISDSVAIARGSGDAIGGGLYVAGGMDMRYSAITDNIAISPFRHESVGGGLVARGVVDIVQSTISSNHADYFGGLDLEDRTNPATIINTTISGNSAAFVGGVFAAGALSVDNSTIAFNASTEWTDSEGRPIAAGLHALASAQIESSIVSNNVSASAPTPTADLSGFAGVSGAHNNIMSCAVACPSDTTHESPGLRPLQDNGGPTKTHATTPGPWDRFGGSNLRNQDWDQRGPGFPREPDGNAIEIGAFQPNHDILFVNGFN